MELSQDLMSRQEARDLVEEASAAQERLKTMSQGQLDKLAEAISKAALANREELARLACEETGFGNVKDKVEKNRFAAETLWNAIQNLKTVGILRKNPEEKTWEIGVPVGVVAGIVPSTNPTSTVIYKAMISVKSGNAIVFSPHPGAKNATIRTAALLAQAVEAAGAPKGTIGCITIPTMDAVNELMKHPKVRLILATGGGAMVRSAYSSGTPAIGVGAGNGPAYLHPSCDLSKAVGHIVRSKTFDNGTICASEQSVIVERSNCQRALAELQRQGCHLLTESEGKQLAKFLFRPNGAMSPRIVGKTALEIAKVAGLEVPPDTKVLLARETGVGKDHPYSHEKLCPVLGLYEVEGEEEALGLAREILEGEGTGHTFVIHSENQEVVEKFALEIPVSRFLVNTPAALGGIGATTNLFPALTLGCGAAGGSSSSNNIGPLDLIDIRRVAWGNETHREGYTTDESLLERLTEKLLERIGV